jgi:hypothetical protein
MNNPKESPMSLAPVVYACKTRHLVDLDQEDGSQVQYRKIVCENPVTKVTRLKMTGDVVQAVENIFCKCKSLSSRPSPQK